MSFNDIIVDRQECKDNKDNNTSCGFVIEKKKIISSTQIPFHKKKITT